MSMPKYISVPAAGKLLGRSPRSVRRLVDLGVLDAVRVPHTHPRLSYSQVLSHVPARLRPGEPADQVAVRLVVPIA
jgi:hypothetical protein